MQKTINIKCPQCDSSNVQVNIEKDGRLAFDCQQCSNRFFADEDLKVKDFNLKNDNINFNVTVEFNSGNTSELDQKISELVQKGNYLKAVKFYQEEKKSSLKDAKTYVDELTGFQDKIQSSNDFVLDKTINFVSGCGIWIVAGLICLLAYLLI